MALTQRRIADLLLTQHGMITAGQALDAGMTRAAIGKCRDTGRWRAVLAGTYLVGADAFPTKWSDLPFRTRLSAALLTHGTDAVAVLGTAAALHELPGRPWDDGTIHLRLPPGLERHQQSGVALHTWRMDESDVISIHDIRTTSVRRTLADAVLSFNRCDSVSLLDAALNQRAIRPDELGVVESLLAGRRGAVDARRRIGDANGLAQSPLETRIRLIAADAGIPPHYLQYAVRDVHGVLLGYGDMAWERPGRRILVAEADGLEVHGRPEALYRDRSRANDFVTAGAADIVRFTWEDTRRPAYVVSVLRRNLRP